MESRSGTLGQDLRHKDAIRFDSPSPERCALAASGSEDPDSDGSEWWAARRAREDAKKKRAQEEQAEKEQHARRRKQLEDERRHRAGGQVSAPSNATPPPQQPASSARAVREDANKKKRAKEKQADKEQHVRKRKHLEDGRRHRAKTLAVPQQGDGSGTPRAGIQVSAPSSATTPPKQPASSAREARQDANKKKQAQEEQAEKEQHARRKKQLEDGRRHRPEMLAVPQQGEDSATPRAGVQVSAPSSATKPPQRPASFARELSQSDVEPGAARTLSEVRDTLATWVQGCLARPDRRQRVLGGSKLKCRLRANDDIEGDLRLLVAGYGGELAKARGDEVEPASSGGQWFVAFGAASFEAFMSKHPEVVEPFWADVRAFADTFVGKEGLAGPALLDEFLKALVDRFGPLRPASLERAGRTLAEARRELQQTPQLKCRGAESPVPGVGPDGADKRGEARPRTWDAPPLGSAANDMAWAAGVLAPWGLLDSGRPVVFCPAVVAAALLQALLALASLPGLKDSLLSSGLGRVVGGYRRHPDAGVAKASQDLVAAWKRACGC